MITVTIQRMAKSVWVNNGYEYRDQPVDLFHAESVEHADQFARNQFGSIPYAVTESGNYRYYIRQNFSDSSTDLNIIGFQIKGFANFNDESTP